MKIHNTHNDKCTCCLHSVDLIFDIEKVAVQYGYTAVKMQVEF